jgi:3-deoxy-7-phosphoheptulonate synthase
MLKREDLLRNHKPLIIAGPCAVESREQIRTIAKKLHDMGVKILRCQLWKPRTDKESFQGVGLEGLEWLKEIKEELGILIATEIVDKDHIEATRGVTDILWVGARNMQNYELLKAIEFDSRPVILKRGLIATVDEWLKAARYIGLERVILCERGVRTGADAMRFTLDINAALVAKHDHKMPVIVDPSHTAGRSDMVAHLALAAMGAGLDGIVAEVHHQPEKALSDANQQITPETFKKIIKNVKLIYDLTHKVAEKEEKLEDKELVLPLIRSEAVNF